MKFESFPELLAPAGNLEKLKIAVLYGADAVYVAGPQFSLRAGTDNLSNIEMESGISFAHERGSKIYVALNAFLHDADLAPLPEYVRFLEDCNVDLQPSLGTGRAGPRESPGSRPDCRARACRGSRSAREPQG